MLKNNIQIWNTYAEAFPMKCSRLIITAENYRWAFNAVNSFTGFATSVIACGCEAGIEKKLKKVDTPDGRPGYSILIFSMSEKELAKQVLKRTGQCVMTSPSSAIFSGNKGEKKIKLGSSLRYFGDGYQISKKFGDKRFWRIPVMDGEFICEDFAYQMSGIGGGNFLILGESQKSVIEACEVAVKSMKELDNVILPFPGGVVRSGSKVGSKYKSLIASTNFEYCPNLKDIVSSKLKPNIKSVLEIVIDGISFIDISIAMKVGIQSILKKKLKGVIAISAGNYGGKLGPHLFHLREILK